MTTTICVVQVTDGDLFDSAVECCPLVQSVSSFVPQESQQSP